MAAWWKLENGASVAWLGLFVPGFLCYLHFLMLHLNQYPEVEGSEILANVPKKLEEIIPPGAKVRQGGQWKPRLRRGVGGTRIKKMISR